MGGGVPTPGKLTELPNRGAVSYPPETHILFELIPRPLWDVYIRAYCLRAHHDQASILLSFHILPLY